MALSSCPLAPGVAFAACYQAVFKGVARVPFVCIGDEPLTAKLALRLQPDERDALRAEADETYSAAFARAGANIASISLRTR